MELIEIAVWYGARLFVTIMSILSGLYVWDCLRHGWRGNE